MTERPDFVTDAHLRYLDDLRKSGKINIFGARKWLEDDFGLSRTEAGEILSYWMDSFGERHNLSISPFPSKSPSTPPSAAGPPQ